jgi:hypothetical protein
LFAGDDEGRGVDATAQEVHGCAGVGAVWFDAISWFRCGSYEPP